MGFMDTFKIILWVILTAIFVAFINICLLYLIYKSICDGLDSFETVKKTCTSIDNALNKNPYAVVLKTLIEFVTMMRKKSTVGEEPWLDVGFTLFFLLIGLGSLYVFYIQYVRNKNRDTITKYITLGALGIFATLFSILFIISLISSITKQLKKSKIFELRAWVDKSLMPPVKFHVFSLFACILVVLALHLPSETGWINGDSSIVSPWKWYWTISHGVLLLISFFLVNFAGSLGTFIKWFKKQKSGVNYPVAGPAPSKIDESALPFAHRATGGGARRKKSKRSSSSSKAKVARRLKQRRRASSR